MEYDVGLNETVSVVNSVQHISLCASVTITFFKNRTTVTVKELHFLISELGMWGGGVSGAA